MQGFLLFRWKAKSFSIRKWNIVRVLSLPFHLKVVYKLHSRKKGLLDGFLVGGSDRKMHLMNTNGKELYIFLEREAWIWCTECSKTSCETFLAIGTSDGTCSMYTLTIPDLYVCCNEWYVQRKGLDTLNLHHLRSTTSQRHVFDQPIRSVHVHEVWILF